MSGSLLTVSPEVNDVQPLEDMKLFNSSVKPEKSLALYVVFDVPLNTTVVPVTPE